MNSAIIKPVKVNQIDIDDRSYVFSFEAPLSPLILSIKNVGIIHPPILEQTSAHRYRIVSGFKRVLAAQHLKMEDLLAAVYQGASAEPSLELFLINFHENLGTRMLNDIEKAIIIFKLINIFHVSRDQILSQFMPLMGLASNQIVLNRYLKLVELEDYVKSAMVEDFISPETAMAMLELTPQERVEIYHVFQSLKAGKNHQRELLRLLKELSIMKNQPISQIFDSLAIRDILTNVRLTATQKLEKVKHALKEARYPNYSAALHRFQNLKAELKLPPNISLRPPQFFEGSEYTIELRFKNQDEFNKAVKILSALAEANKLVALETLV